jgi:hypothetical protein
MEYLNLWWVQAAIISAGAALLLNGAPFLPYLNRIKARKMDARIVGFGGTTLAYGLWCKLNPGIPAQDAFLAWFGICLLTVGVNWIIHMVRRDNPPADDYHNNGRLPPIIIVSADKCEEVLQHLVDPRRNLVVAQEGIRSAILRARQAAERMPDQASAQIWVQAVREPLETSSKQLEEMEDDYTGLYEAVANMWQVFNEIKNLWKQGLIPICGES